MRRSRQTRRQSLDAGDWSSSQDTSSFGQVQPSAEISRPRSSDDVDNVDDELAYDDSPTLPISHDNSYSQWDENVRSFQYDTFHYPMDTFNDLYNGDDLDRLADAHSYFDIPMTTPTAATPQKRKDRRQSDRMASPIPGRQRISSPQLATGSTPARAGNGRQQHHPSNAQQTRSSSRLTVGAPSRQSPKATRRGPLIDHEQPRPNMPTMRNVGLVNAPLDKPPSSQATTQNATLVLYYKLEDALGGGNGAVRVSHPPVQPMVNSRLNEWKAKNQPKKSSIQPARSSSQEPFAFRDPNLVSPFVPRSPTNLSLDASLKKVLANAQATVQLTHGIPAPLSSSASSGKARLTSQASSSKGSAPPTEQTSMQQAISAASPTPPHIPFEIYELIAQHLSRADIRNMRLVSRNFEEGISPLLFRSVVVPFNPQVYGRLGEPPGMQARGGKQKANEAKPTSIDLDIFPGFGPHIRRFGMSFDLNLFDLANPPSKNLQEGIAAFWGRYKWPFRYYRRFQDRAELEVAADETQVMKRAFAHLEKAQELGISLDCGLGWLNGSDLSVRAQILRQTPNLFGMMYSADASTMTKRKLWQYVENHYLHYGCLDDLKVAELVRNSLDPSSQTEVAEQGPSYHLKDALLVHEATFDDTDMVAPGKSFSRDKGLYGGARSGDSGDHRTYRMRRPSRSHGLMADDGSDDIGGDYEMLIRRQLDAIKGINLKNPSRHERTAEALSAIAASVGLDEAVTTRGALYIRSPFENKTNVRQSASTLTPNSLTMAQKEWMLETSWAQEAFLSSYMIAVTDNASTFSAIKKLTLARFSSKHVGKLCRTDFWNAFQSLQEVDLKVIADYRDVQKTEAGFAEIKAVAPSAAVSSVLVLLQDHIGQKEKIHTVSIGWADGGEHAEGISARNKLLLPAPILSKQTLQAFPIAAHSALSLPYVKHLEMVNCWTTPNALEDFILNNCKHALRKLTLNSVSLTAHPKFGRNQAHNAHNIAAQAANAQQPGQAPMTAGANPAAVQAFMQGAMNGAAAHVQAQGPAIQQQILAAWQQANQQHGPSRRRDGAWTDVLDRLKTRLTQQEQTVFELELLSCGYARLTTPTFDQFVLDQAEAANSLSQPLPHSRTNFHTNRQAQLSGKMIECSDGNLGSIVTALPNGELEELTTDWGCYAGWPREDLLPADHRDDDGWGRWGWRTMEGPEYDGGRIGGSGRFSGRISHWVALVDG